MPRKRQRTKGQCIGKIRCKAPNSRRLQSPINGSNSSKAEQSHGSFSWSCLISRSLPLESLASHFLVRAVSPACWWRRRCLYMSPSQKERAFEYSSVRRTTLSAERSTLCQQEWTGLGLVLARVVDVYSPPAPLRRTEILFCCLQSVTSV